MKSTEYLTVMGDLKLRRNDFVIHPNDGYDLGILSRDNEVRIFTGASLEEFAACKGEGVSGTIRLHNSCAASTVRMSLAWWNELGKPRIVRLAFERDRLFISQA
jgi:hypothetical protein